MSKLFMYGTSLEGIEQLMMLVPNFQPRRSGIIINNYFNFKEGVKNCNCNMLNVSNRCNDCGYIIAIFYPMWIRWDTKIWLKNALENKKLFFKG